MGRIHNWQRPAAAVLTAALLCTRSAAQELKPTPLQLAPESDIFLDLCYGPHDPDVVRAKLTVFKDLGFKRVYFVAANPGYPQYGMNFLDFIAEPEAYGNFAEQSVRETVDINRVMIEQAHELGLEAWPVFKPYEGGVGLTQPVGQKHPVREKGLPDVGGTAYGFDEFILKHPEMRLQRKPDPDYDRLVDQAIERIDLFFWMDNEPYARRGKTIITEEELENLSVWVSEDNGSYRELKSGFSIEQDDDEIVVTDADGWPLYDGQKKACRVVRITDLDLPKTISYVAVTFDNPDGLHATIPFSMIKMYGKKGEIPSTCTAQIRKELRKLGVSWENRPVPQFNTHGFEFEYHGWGPSYPGWHRSDVYGIARGKNQFLKGLLCEAYPEVREYWLNFIRHLLDCGADGIDIRLVNHSGMVTDFGHYGFNEPVMDIYEDRTGSREVETLDDYRNIMRIRGEFFMQFLRDAREEITRKDRKLQVHLNHVYLDLNIDGFLRGLVQWGQPKIFPDWKEMVDLADEITIKSHYNGVYNPDDCGPMKERAFQQNKPVWIMCYLTQGPDLQPSLFAGAEKDERISGVIFYETVKRNNPNYGMNRPGIVGAAPDKTLMLDQEVIATIKQLMGDSTDEQN